MQSLPNFGGDYHSAHGVLDLTNPLWGEETIGYFNWQANLVHFGT
jgi:hypothetical protein